MKTGFSNHPIVYHSSQHPDKYVYTICKCLLNSTCYSIFVSCINRLSEVSKVLETSVLDGKLKPFFDIASFLMEDEIIQTLKK